MNFITKNKRTGLILVIIGFLFIIHNFGIFNFGTSLWKFSPLLLVWWGLHLLRKRGKVSHKEGDFQIFGDTMATISSPYIKNSSAFGDILIKIENDRFSGGTLSNIFGKISLDLTSVSHIEGYGQLDIHSVFGDVVIKVPEHIAFEVSGSNIFGSTAGLGGKISNSSNFESPGFDEAEDKIIIRTSMVFGDVEITR
ncbi:MAG: hypothetical protein JW746_00505 [Candidatus Krumholzibacteriota bacterium]|nr:hypothetical protein [Candidatus Krumholzibacteriota bacterium]